jgi:hypothetical protein
MSTVNDPVRLIADPGFPESQRALLRQGASLEPPAGAEDAVWRALAGALGAAVVGGAAADVSGKTTTAAAKAAGLTASKLVAVVLALGALAGMVALGRMAFLPAKTVTPVVEPVVDRGAGPSPAGLRPATSPRFAGRGKSKSVVSPRPAGGGPRA